MIEKSIPRVYQSPYPLTMHHLQQPFQETVGIKSLLNAASIIAALINVNAAQSKLVLLEKDEANVAFIEEWDDIQAKIETNQELAQRLQAEEQEELSVEEKAKLFQQLLELRRKHFAAKSAEEKRSKPPTQAKQRKIMCTYLKNMEGKKPKDMKNKYFDSIQKMFDRAFKRVNTFVDFRTDLVEGSSKRAGEELEQESTKKQKVDEDKDTAELQSLMEVILDKEEVAIDDVPLATKPSTIIDWKIHKEGKKSYYQIVRADGKSQMYKVFSLMLKNVSREDLEDLYKLVKAKYKSTRPVEDLYLVLWSDLKTIALLEFAIWNDLHAGRKEISHYTTYNYRYAEQEASGRIVRIKSLLNAASITAALIDVNIAQSKLVPLENFNENYSKCLRLLVKLLLLEEVTTAGEVTTASTKLLLLEEVTSASGMNAAERVNAASEEVSTTELLKEFDLLKWDQQVVSELVALRNFARRYGLRFCTHGGCIQSSYAPTG
ncbi:hypothetical protein Tco_1554504 [Tanacetum coccineum]